jgi:hypothetical protein
VDKIYHEKIKKQDIKLDLKLDEEKRIRILDLIERNINRKYFSEKKLAAFFDLCFSI